MPSSIKQLTQLRFSWVLVFVRSLLAMITLMTTQSIFAFDPMPLWNFKDTALSEQRFLQVLATAAGDDAIIIKTQIARTYGLRKNFARAQEILQELEPQIALASPTAQTRYFLELGRSYSSNTHSPDSQTIEVKEKAREAFKKALAIAKKSQLDALAIDVTHMFAFIDKEPVDQLKWSQAALAIVLKSDQPAAKLWEGSVRNNMAMALHSLNRLDDALAQFKLALAHRKQSGNTEQVFVAEWMVAWTLRTQLKIDEALEIQLRLEREMQANGKPAPYVFEELALLFKAKGNEERSLHYTKLHLAK
jgi:tetratricopeptide (TPR) repeat protein